ncbi:hypothetical protein [uncultured Marixanthomonas sp.]|uniref:hypothetical protein n=1 Tax=uncultured Marixanthomonas sp. TaxID=757245 RepID=UPI0030DB7542|tara:strand:- start:241627 stop:241920 length:294 start_codon:yes stop_codon:yes gene_type:complete
MSTLQDLVGRTVNIDIEGLQEGNEPLEMAFVITDVRLNDYYFIEKPFEQIFIEISATPVNFETLDKDLKEWWIDNYSDHYFSLEELKWHPDYNKKVK